MTHLLFLFLSSMRNGRIIPVCASIAVNFIILSRFIVYIGLIIDKLLTYCRKIMLSNILFSLNFSIDFFVK